MSNTATIDDEINLRVARASASFGRLRDRVWNRRGLSFETKLQVYRAVVLPSLLYGSETWTVYAPHERQLQSFHMRCLRQILRVKWQDCIPDTEILQRSNSKAIGTMLMETQLRWAGHVARMPIACLREYYLENCVMANAPVVDQKSVTRTRSKSL